MLEAALKYSKDMVNARKNKGNLNYVKKDDSDIILQIQIAGAKMLLNKVVKKEKEKENIIYKLNKLLKSTE